MHVKRYKTFAAGLMLAAVLTGCGGGAADTNVGVFQGAPDEPIPGGGASTGSGGNALVVDSGEAANLTFQQEDLTASTGTVELTFNNKGSLPHNWTLIKPGDLEAAVQQAQDAGAPDYKSEIALAQTATIDGGKSDTITFDISEPGTYEFICTFPGHAAAGMVGTLTVVADEGASPGGEVSSGASSTLTSNSADAANLAFAETELEADAGDVTLTFNNKGSIPHNWTLVKQGEEQQAIDESQGNAPDYKAPSAIAQTATINGGESDTITFNLAPGTYEFICTFPGHYAAGMKGTLVVK